MYFLLRYIRGFAEVELAQIQNYKRDYCLKMCSQCYHSGGINQNTLASLLDSMLESEQEPSVPLSVKQRAMSQPSMVTTIKRSKVPHYLRKSALYLSLSDKDDDEISVPYNCMKMDLEFKGVCDLEHLMLTMRFWIKKYFPDEAIAFMLKSQSLKTNVLLQKHKQEHPQVHMLVGNLRPCKEVDKCTEACRFGRLDFLNYFIKQGYPMSLDTLAVAANNGHLECVMHVYKIFKKEKFLPSCWRYIDVREAAGAACNICWRLGCLLLYGSAPVLPEWTSCKY